MAVLLALLSAVSWGTGDFLGGRLSRRERVIVVLTWSQGVGLLAAGVYVLVSGEAWPGLAELWPALVAGSAGAVALACFYQALAVGTMSVVAPISATAVAVPVAVGLSTGDDPGAASLAGIVLAAVGVVLASREEHADEVAARASRVSVALALAAALGFGIFFTAIDGASDASVPWALLLVRSASVSLCLCALTASRGRRRPARADLPQVVAVGLLDTGANALFAFASTKGLLSVVSVLGSLYPVMTVLLAWLLLHERLVRVQQVGVALAFAGVTLLSL